MAGATEADLIVNQLPTNAAYLLANFGWGVPQANSRFTPK
jgi:hypothetical protein